jgi:putative hemolysin
VLERVGLEVLLILLLVLANGAFAMSEIALVSVRKPRLQQLAQRGSRGAARALEQAESPDRFLSTVQIGITLIGILAGAFGGATIAAQIDQQLETVPVFRPYSEVIGVFTVVLGIGYLSLVLGELVPKRLAMNNPERVAIVMATPMRILSRAAAPAVAVLVWSTRAVLRVLGQREPVVPAVTEEELMAMARAGTEAGTIDRQEREIVERVFRLGDRPVTAIMTPRVELEWLDFSKPIEELRAQVAASAHEWFPAARDRIDDLRGIVRAKDLWSGSVASSDDVAEVMREPIFVPDTMSVFPLLQRLRESRTHVAIVIEEFGAVRGMVTLTDLLEGLVGELPEQSDIEEPMIVRRDDGSWSIDAATDLDEVKLMLGLDYLDGEKDSYQTVAGYLVDRLGDRPRLGDSFEVNGLRFEVLDTDGRRIDRILVERTGNGSPG